MQTDVPSEAESVPADATSAANPTPLAPEPTPDPDAFNAVESALGYRALAPKHWTVVDQHFLETNPGHAERATTAMREAGGPVEALTSTFDQIGRGVLDVYFLPHPKHHDTLEVRALGGTVPGSESEVPGHCSQIEQRMAIENQRPIGVTCALTRYGTHPVFVVNARSAEGAEITLFQLARAPGVVLTLTARLDPATSLSHAGDIRSFVKSLVLEPATAEGSDAP